MKNKGRPAFFTIDNQKSTHYQSRKSKEKEQKCKRYQNFSYLCAELSRILKTKQMYN